MTPRSSRVRNDAVRASLPDRPARFGLEILCRPVPELFRSEHVHLLAGRPVHQENGVTELFRKAPDLDGLVPHDLHSVLSRLFDKDVFRPAGVSIIAVLTEETTDQ